MAKKKQGKKLQAKSSRSFPPNQHYNWLRNQQDVDDLERFVDEGRTLKDMATYFGTKVGRVESCLSDYNLLELRKANEKRMTRPIENKIESDFVGPPYELSRDEITNDLTGKSSSADTRVETPSQLESSSSNSENLFETPVATSDAELRKEVGLPSKPIYQLPKQSTVGRTSTQTPEREPVSSSRSYSPYAPIIDGPGLTSPFVYDSSFVHPSINSMPPSTGSSPAPRPASPAPTAQTETPRPSTQPQTATQPKMTLWQNLRSSRHLLIKTLVGTAVLGAITLQATGHGFNFRSSKREYLAAGDSHKKVYTFKYEGVASFPGFDKPVRFLYKEDAPSFDKPDTIVNAVHLYDPSNVNISYRLEDIVNKENIRNASLDNQPDFDKVGIERVVIGKGKSKIEGGYIAAGNLDSTLVKNMNTFYTNALKQAWAASASK